MVERGRRLRMGAEHPRGIGEPGLCRKSDIIDAVAAPRREGYIAVRFGWGRSRFGELPRHPPHLHDRQLRGVCQHRGHLEDDAKRVADRVGMEIDESFGAIACLEQEGAARPNFAEHPLEFARFTGEDEWRLRR